MTPISQAADPVVARLPHCFSQVLKFNISGFFKSLDYNAVQNGQEMLQVPQPAQAAGAVPQALRKLLLGGPA